MNDLKKEEGYILVAVIGILTILSLMTITFATLSRIETRATRNYTDSVKCEMVAKAGLEYAIYEIWLDKFGTDTLAYNDDDNGNYGLDENFDSSGTSWPGDGVFPDTGADDYDNDGNGTDDSTWVYFPTDTATTSATRLPGNLLARYAVLITDDREARVNINVTGNEANGGAHTSNEGWSTFEIDLSNIIELAATGKGVATASNIIDTRHGSGGTPKPGTSSTNDDLGKIPDPATDGIDNDGDWDSSTHDTNSNGIPDSVTPVETNVDEADEVTDEPNEFNSIFPYSDDVPFGLLTEAEIMGTSSYESRLEEIFGNNTVSLADQETLKGWLTTYSADTILCPPYTLDGGTSTTKLNINALIYNEGAYDDNEVYYDSDKKVEMIIDVLTAGGVPDVERQQIAVNIIDFIDSDDTVTKYPESLIPTPVYYGVERTPYMNEVEAHVAGHGNGRFIELFNPYDTDISILNWTITFSGPTTITLGTVGTTTINARDYYVVADNALAYETTFNYEGGGAAELYDANVSRLDQDGEVLTLRDAGNNIVQVTDYSDFGDEGHGESMQLNDPRPTPLEDENGGDNPDASAPWRWKNKNTITAGAENDNFDPSPSPPNQDDEWTSDTWSSSFLVANRRFSNKGYLGFIHTGRQWYSFKVDDNIVYPDVLQYFTVTDPSMDNIDNDGDGSTDSADTGSQAGDFDGQEHRIPGLINVNTAPIEVLESLPDITNGIATAISGGGKPYSSIGDLVVKVPDITNTGATKWDKEKPLRSISNLITTRSNVFTVYVTAQITDEAISSVYAEKRIIAIIDRSVDPIRVRYFRWITE